MKHRQNTNQKQRIIAFLGSPLPESVSKESLKEIGMKMKKNGVAIDIIDFGTENRGNTELLSNLIDSCDSEAIPSRLITILENSSSGTFLLDSLRSKVPELFNISSAGASNDGNFDFDPEMDPELAMALKLSMEEEVNRQKMVNNNPGDSDADGDESGDDQENLDVENENENMEEDEELLLARAIALSMEQQPKESKN